MSRIPYISYREYGQFSKVSHFGENNRIQCRPEVHAGDICAEVPGLRNAKILLMAKSNGKTQEELAAERVEKRKEQMIRIIREINDQRKTLAALERQLEQLLAT